MGFPTQRKIKGRIVCVRVVSTRVVTTRVRQLCLSSSTGRNFPSRIGYYLKQNFLFKGSSAYRSCGSPGRVLLGLDIEIRAVEGSYPTPVLNLKLSDL